MNRNLEYKIERDTLSRIPPRALRAYIEARGWRKAGTYPGLADVYEFDEDGPGIRVAASIHFADYPLRMWEAVSALADTEDREWSAVLRDLALGDLDTIRVRWSGDSNDGSIPIGAGMEMLRHSHYMLLTAACSAQRPHQRVFRPRANKKAKEYVKNVRLGQTERGSFVIHILSPVHTEPEHLHAANPGAEPFPRKVVNKLASGLGVIHEVARLVATRDYRSEMLEEWVAQGMSANLCAAVGGMLGNGSQSGLDISVSWALTHVPPSREPSEVHFRESDAPILEEASQVLKRTGG